jgi:hypothetical protein
LTPPGGFFPSYGQLDWIEKVTICYIFVCVLVNLLFQVLPQLTTNTGDVQGDMPLECVQKAGDILYVPEGWYHAVSVLKSVRDVQIQFVLP